MGLWVICAVGLVFCMVFVSSFFDITAMSPRCVLLCVNFSIVAEPCMRYLTLGMKQVQRLFIRPETVTGREEKKVIEYSSDR